MKITQSSNHPMTFKGKPFKTLFDFLSLDHIQPYQSSLTSLPKSFFLKSQRARKSDEGRLSEVKTFDWGEEEYCSDDFVMNKI